MVNRKADFALNSLVVLIGLAFVANLLGWSPFAGSDGTSSTEGAIPPPALLAEWRALEGDGRTVGSAAAPVSIIVFSDFECPFCARLHLEIWPALKSEFGEQVSLTIVHYPLQSHRFAVPAAMAVECAAEQGRFEVMLDLVYQRQDSIGIIAWRELAERAGVPAVPEFEVCHAGPQAEKVRRGLDWANRLAVSSTPTILVNGWRYFGVPPQDELTRAIREFARGGVPF